MMNLAGGLVFNIDAFDSRIRVECANLELFDMLNRYMLPPLPHRQDVAGDPDISICVDRCQDEFRVLINGEAVASALNLHDATLAAVKALDGAVVDRLKTLCAIHAGVVAIDGGALILPGFTHAGKSTLVAELLGRGRGVSHFSDEYALIDGDGYVHAYPRPLLLRNGGPFQSLTLPTDLNSRYADGHPVPVRWIVATSYIPAGTWMASKISQSEAVTLLLRNTPHEMAERPEILGAFLRVASNAACYEGTRGEAVEAADRILDLIRRK